ncbi:MAG: hypothetical protein K0S30_1646 [Clostridia bacterium]|nr:hypothetical protein [Clostridia bacterium]
MSFLLNYNNTFFTIDNNSKYGVFCQLYSQTGLSRPIQIQSLNCTDYSAAINRSGSLHAISMPSRHQITYFCYENGHYIKKSLVENATETYLDTNYTFQNIKSFSHEDTIYLFYIVQTDSYILNCLKIKDSKVEIIPLFSSKVPIYDYCVCLKDHQIYITYIAELHGKYQLIFYSVKDKLSNVLCNTLSPSDPVIFWYYDYLWVNYLEDNKLYALLSINGGRSFSSPVLCSLQNAIGKYIFTTDKNCSLKCTELYASLGTSIRLATLYAIDFENIHPDSKISLELELLFEGLLISQKSSDSLTSLSQENETLKAELKTLKLQYDRLLSGPAASHTDDKPASSIKSAASAFMEELPNWDAPPRL